MNKLEILDLTLALDSDFKSIFFILHCTCLRMVALLFLIITYVLFFVNVNCMKLEIEFFF